MLYLFNPLPRAGLAQVLANLEQSLQESDRKVLILYHNPLHDEVLSASGRFTRSGGTHQYSIYENL